MLALPQNRARIQRFQAIQMFARWRKIHITGVCQGTDEVPASQANDGNTRNQLKVTNVQACH